MSNVLNMVSEETFVAQTNAIKSAIDAIADGGGSDEFLLKPTGTVTVSANHSFSIPYVGIEPLVNIATVLIPNAPKGISTDGISYTLQFSRGNVVFTRYGGFDGVLTAAVDCIIQIGESWYKVTMQGLPVKYVYSSEHTMPLTFSVEEETEEETILCADISSYIYPKSVTPQAKVTDDYFMCFLCDMDGYMLYHPTTQTIENSLYISLNKEDGINVSEITDGYCIGNDFSFVFTFQLAEAAE